MSKETVKTQIDTDITNKTTSKSISPTNVGNNMKAVVDLISIVDGSETKIIEGANTTITGSGTDIDPYVVSTTTVANTSELVNDGSDGTSTYIEADDLSTVATSGSYNDLVNKPYNFITITKAELDTLIANSELSVGATYEITGVHPTLYNDGTNAGTTIFLQALTTNRLSHQGNGIFYNPKYGQSVSGFGIWSDFMDGTFSNIVGEFNYSSKEEVIADNGAVGSILAEGLIKYISGDWSTATMISGASSMATANISSFVSPSYSINDKVIWGGYSWTNITGDIGSSIDILNLDTTNWLKDTYDEINYNKVIDIIECDIDSDWISRRYEEKMSNDVTFTKKDSLSLTNQYGCSSISAFMFGNTFNFNTWRGVFNNKIENSYFESVNFRGSYINSNTLTNYSYIESNIFTNNSYIASNTLTNNSNIASNILTNYSYIESNILTIGNITSNTLTKYNYITSNTLTNYSNIASNALTNYSNIASNTLTNNSNIASNTLTNNSNIASNTLTNNSNIASNILTIGNITSNTLTKYNYITSNTLTNYSNIASNALTNYSNIASNTLTNNSNIASNTLTNNSNIASNILTIGNITSNTLTNNSRISLNTLIDGSHIASNILTNYSYIESNALTDYSRITLNTLASSSISIGLSNILTSKVLTLNTIENVSINMNITTGNIIFLNYLKSIYTRPDGTPKIRYYNDSDVLVIADITD